jgi:hypothetical protein
MAKNVRSTRDNLRLANMVPEEASFPATGRNSEKNKKLKDITVFLRVNSEPAMNALKK